MSEPLSSSEIEDVLSSIRRLVSEDMRPTHGANGAGRSAAAKPQQPVAAAPADNKLILTPALRVVHREEASGRADVPLFVATPRVPPAGAEPGNDSAAIESVLASLGAGVDSQNDEWEPENGDTAPTASGLTDAVLAEARLDQVQNFEFPLSQQAAEAEAAEAEAEAEAEEAGFIDMAEEGEQDFIVSADAEVYTPAWAQTVPEDEAEDAGDELEAMPEDADADWVDEAEASVIAALEADVAEEVSQGVRERVAEVHDDHLDQDMRIDEELLRDLVRDVLREELAGRIGERITRNIRKLVRAEIANALAMQELG